MTLELFLESLGKRWPESHGRRTLKAEGPPHGQTYHFWRSENSHVTQI